MKWMIPLPVAIVAAAIAGVFFWRRRQAKKSIWTRATHTTYSGAKKATDKVSSAASAAADGIKGAAAT